MTRMGKRSQDYLQVFQMTPSSNNDFPKKESFYSQQSNSTTGSPDLLYMDELLVNPFFVKGDRVQALHEGQHLYLSGTVGVVDEQTGLLSIHFDNGDLVVDVRPETVRRVGQQRIHTDSVFIDQLFEGSVFYQMWYLYELNNIIRQCCLVSYSW
jgi:hypothetical protein